MWAVERYRDHHDHLQTTAKYKLETSIQYFMVCVQATTARKRRVHGAVVRWRPALVREMIIVFLGLRVLGERSRFVSQYLRCF